MVVVLVGGLAAAILGLAVFAQGVPTGDVPRVLDPAVEAEVRVDHLWLDDIRQKVDVSRVDASVQHRG